MQNKIIINCIPLLSTLTGVGKYNYEICRHLLNTNELDKSYYYGYYSKKIKNLTDNDKNITKRFLINNIFIKKILKKALIESSKIYSPAYDIYWEPNFIPLKHIKADYIVTSVHDLSFKFFGDCISNNRKKHFDKNFDKMIHYSDSLICFSHYIKQELIDTLGFSEDKINVIYHGVRHDIFRVYDKLENSHNLPEKFILFVGSIEPRKNLKRLLKAYIQLDNSFKKKYKLVLAGFKGWKNTEIFEMINQNQQDIKYLGYISDYELAELYNRASLFVFPSLYEGFGLPLLESMACGTPIITSNVSSMPEIAGDAAYYVDPYDETSIKNGIEELINNGSLRETMKNKGLRRAGNYTWEKSANMHLKVFKNILNTS